MRPLYKYMSRKTGRAVIENRTLRWSRPGTFNDPYELQFVQQFDIDFAAVRASALLKLWDAFYSDQDVIVGNPFGEIIQAMRGLFPKLSREEFDREFGEGIDESLRGMERAWPDFVQVIGDFMAEYKLLCLTETPDNKLMWAHYAERHQGVVLEFRSVQGLDSPYTVARPIVYLDEIPALIGNDLLADIASGRAKMDAQLIIDKILYTKSSDWSYEREWRISTGVGRDASGQHEDAHFHALELSAVIIGCKMPKDDRATIIELTTRLYPHASIRQTRMAGNKYQLELEPL